MRSNKNLYLAVFQTLLALAAAGLVTHASAQAWPSKPLRIIIGYGPGGVTDVMARLLGAELSPKLGQPVVVENRLGASGAIAAVAVKTAPPDGYTLMSGSSNSFSPTFLKEGYVVSSKELAPISITAYADWFLYAPAGINVSNLKELAAYANSHKGQFRFAAPSQSNTMLVASLAKQMGWEFENVPYKATDQTIQALLSGDAQLTLNAAPGFEGFVSSGKLRAIASLSDRRSSLMTAAIPAAEQGVPLVSRSMQGLWSALGTPQDVINKLNAATVETVKNPATVEKIRKLALEPGGSTPAELIAATEAEAKFYVNAAALTGFKAQ